MVIGNRLFTYSTWEFYCHLMQVFDERQELIKNMKGKSLRKIWLNKWKKNKNAD